MPHVYPIAPGTFKVSNLSQEVTSYAGEVYFDFDVTAKDGWNIATFELFGYQDRQLSCPTTITDLTLEIFRCANPSKYFPHHPLAPGYERLYEVEDFEQSFSEVYACDEDDCWEKPVQQLTVSSKTLIYLPRGRYTLHVKVNSYAEFLGNWHWVAAAPEQGWNVHAWSRVSQTGPFSSTHGQRPAFAITGSNLNVTLDSDVVRDDLTECDVADVANTWLFGESEPWTGYSMACDSRTGAVSALRDGDVYTIETTFGRWIRVDQQRGWFTAHVNFASGDEIVVTSLLDGTRTTVSTAFFKISSAPVIAYSPVVNRIVVAWAYSNAEDDATNVMFAVSSNVNTGSVTTATWTLYDATNFGSAGNANLGRWADHPSLTYSCAEDLFLLSWIERRPDGRNNIMEVVGHDLKLTLEFSGNKRSVDGVQARALQGELDALMESRSGAPFSGDDELLALQAKDDSLSSRAFTFVLHVTQGNRHELTTHGKTPSAFDIEKPFFKEIVEQHVSYLSASQLCMLAFVGDGAQNDLFQVLGQLITCSGRRLSSTFYVHQKDAWIYPKHDAVSISVADSSSGCQSFVATADIRTHHKNLNAQEADTGMDSVWDVRTVAGVDGDYLFENSVHGSLFDFPSNDVDHVVISPAVGPYHYFVQGDLDGTMSLYLLTIPNVVEVCDRWNIDEVGAEHGVTANALVWFPDYLEGDCSGDFKVVRNTQLLTNVDVVVNNLDMLDCTGTLDVAVHLRWFYGVAGNAPSSSQYAVFYSSASCADSSMHFNEEDIVVPVGRAAVTFSVDIVISQGTNVLFANDADKPIEECKVGSVKE